MDASEKKHMTFIWQINNFSIPCCVKSPSFIVNEMQMTIWHLEIDCKISGPVVLYIEREAEDDGPDSIEIKYDFSFIGIDGLPLKEDGELAQLEKGTSYYINMFEDAQTFFLGKRAEYLPKDTLTVRCRMQQTGTEISKPVLCSARTLLRENRRIFFWAIREFSTLQRHQRKKFILSITLTTNITLIFFISENEGKEYVNIGIQNSGSDEIRSIKISLLDFEGKVVHFEETAVNDTEETLFSNFFERRKLIDNKVSLLLNDVLSLRFKIEMNAKIITSRIENCRYLNETNLGVIATDDGEIFHCEQDVEVSSSFTQAMKRLLEEGVSSDISLQSGDLSFSAHKNFLSARSAVFRAMFNADMKEKTSKCVEIPDLTGDTLRELLSYIYTDTVGELQWQGAADLYAAADKYELLELKRRCANILKSALSVSNFSAILTVADMHHDQELQESAREFLMCQDAEFFGSDMWRSFGEKNPALAWKISAQMLCNMKRQNGKCLRMS